MVNSSTRVEVLFNRKAQLNVDSETGSSKHNSKRKRLYFDGVPSNRFRSRKPPKNPREVGYKPQQREIRSRKLNELEIADSKFNTRIGSSSKIKPNQEKVRPKANFSRPIESHLYWKSDRTPKLVSKSKFALNTRQSGSTFSLVVNLSRTERLSAFNQKLTQLRNAFPQNFIARGKSKQRYLIIPIVSSKEFKEIDYYFHPFMMESFRSDQTYCQPSNSRQIPGGSSNSVFGIEQNSYSSCLSECQRNQEEGHVLEHVSNFGEGYPDIYRQVLGPTPDESILAALQTVIDMCSAAEKQPVKTPPEQASNNQAVMDWVESEYSILEQNQQNLSQASLYNIQQRKETLHKIKKLVEKKSELDREALFIKDQIESSTSKISVKESYACDKLEDVAEVEEEREEEEEEKRNSPRTVSKLTCSCTTIQSDVGPSLATKFTQTAAVQKAEDTQESYSTTATESTSSKVSQSENSSSKPEQSAEIQSSSEDKSQYDKLSATDTSNKSCECSVSSEEYAKHTGDNTESIQRSDKSIQTLKSVPVSSKSAQANVQKVEANSDKQMPSSPGCICLGKSRSVYLNEGPVLSINCVQTFFSPNQSEKSAPSNLISPNIKSPPICLEDKLFCKCKLQTVNHLAVIPNKPVPNPERPHKVVSGSCKCIQTPTSSRSVQTSEVTSGSSKLSSSAHIDGCWQSQRWKESGSSLTCKCLSNTVLNLRNEQISALEQNKEKSCQKEELGCPEYNKKRDIILPCKRSLDEMSSNILSDQEPTKERSFNSCSCRRSTSAENEIGPVCTDVDKISCSKHLKCSKNSGTLPPVPEESPSKSSLCKRCHTNPTGHSAKLPISVSEKTCTRTKTSHFPCSNVPHRRKHRCLRNGRSKDSPLEKVFPSKNEFSKETQTVGDYLTKPTLQEVRYATVRITKFEKYSTYEILDSSMRKPKCIPKTTETIFVVKNKTNCP